MGFQMNTTVHWKSSAMFPRQRGAFVAFGKNFTGSVYNVDVNIILYYNLASILILYCYKVNR